MAVLSTLMAVIQQRLLSNGQLAGSALGGVKIILEDEADSDTQIEKAIGEEGMVVIIGEPSMKNTMESIAEANMDLVCEIGVGETPELWRRGADGEKDPSKPVCLDVVEEVVASLQGVRVDGYNKRLHVRDALFVRDPGKKRQLYQLTVLSAAIIEGSVDTISGIANRPTLAGDIYMRGGKDLAVNDTGDQVSGLNLDFDPSQVWVEVVVPDGGEDIGARAVNGSWSRDGFVYRLTAPVPGAGYGLQWLILP